MQDVLALLGVVAHYLDRVGVTLGYRLVVDVVLNQLTLDADRPAVKHLTLCRVLHQLAPKVNNHHHIL